MKKKSLKKSLKKSTKRTYKSTEKYKPYDGTHGFKLEKEFFDDGSKDYTISCLCCPENQLKIYTTPDKLYPLIEIGGVLLSWETAERIFAEIFYKKPC